MNQYEPHEALLKIGISCRKCTIAHKQVGTPKWKVKPKSWSYSWLWRLTVAKSANEEDKTWYRVRETRKIPWNEIRAKEKGPNNSAISGLLIRENQYTYIIRHINQALRTVSIVLRTKGAWWWKKRTWRRKCMHVRAQGASTRHEPRLCSQDNGNDSFMKDSPTWSGSIRDAGETKTDQRPVLAPSLPHSDRFNFPHLSDFD